MKIIDQVSSKGRVGRREQAKWEIEKIKQMQHKKLLGVIFVLTCATNSRGCIMFSF